MGLIPEIFATVFCCESLEVIKDFPLVLELGKVGGVAGLVRVDVSCFRRGTRRDWVEGKSGLFTWEI